MWKSPLFLRATWSKNFRVWQKKLSVLGQSFLFLTHDTKGVTNLADYFGLQDFPKPKDFPTPIDELITLDLNGEKEIKILKRTITRHSETDIAKFFKGESTECKDGPMPIFETQPGHYFVDRPAKSSEMFFSFLKNKLIDKFVPYSFDCFSSSFLSLSLYLHILFFSLSIYLSFYIYDFSLLWILDSLS